MKINSLVRYTIQCFLNDFLNEYGVLSYRSVSTFLERRLFDEFVTDYKLPFWCHYGCSKICLAFDDLDIIFKIPIITNYNMLDSKAASEFKRNIKVSNYSTSIPKEADDLCAREVKYYNNARNEGLEQLFCEEKLYTKYHGIPIYTQKRVYDFYEETDKKYRECDEVMIDFITNALDERGFYEEAKWDCLTNIFPFFEDIINRYGPIVFLKLLNFIMKNDINDLHEGNVGYTIDDRPILVDYSGFVNSYNL